MALLLGVLAKPQATAYPLCCSQSIPRRPGGGDGEEREQRERQERLWLFSATPSPAWGCPDPASRPLPCPNQLLQRPP